MTPRTLAPLALALASLSTVACAAPADGDDSALVADVQDDAAPASDARDPALAISGKVTAEPTGVLPSGPGEMNNTQATNSVAVLAVGAAQYDVLQFDFGVAVDHLTSMTGKALVVSKLSAPITVRVRGKKGVPALGGAALGNDNYPLMTLSLVDEAVGGKMATKLEPFATLDTVRITSSRFEATPEGTDEILELDVLKATLSQGGARVSLDFARNRVECLDKCPCGSTNDAKGLGPYMQTPDASWPITPGSTRIEEASVAVSRHAAGVDKGGLMMDVLRLDDFSVKGKLDKAGVCAVWQAAHGATASSVVVDVASTVSLTTQKPSTATRWEGCRTTPRAVHFASSPNGTTQELSFVAQGIVRTDNTHDAKGGVASTTTNGWSFTTNTEIAACSEL